MLQSLKVNAGFLGAVAALLVGTIAPGGAVRADDEVKKIPFFRYVSAEGSETIKQTKGKVTVEATLLGESGYDFPQVFAFDDKDLEASGASKGGFDLNVWRWFPADATGKHWVNVFGHPNGFPTVVAFWIKVRNDTDHIINFSKDAKMFVQVTGAEEPAPPIKDLTAQLYPVIIGWEKDYEKTREKGFFSVSYPVGFAATLFDWRFGRWQEQGFANKDILPGFSSSGLILFAVAIDPKTTEDVALMLYEVPSETDAAGNVTAKSRFTFRYQREPRLCWRDKDTLRVRCGPAVATK